MRKLPGLICSACLPLALFGCSSGQIEESGAVEDEPAAAAGLTTGPADVGKSTVPSIIVGTSSAKTKFTVVVRNSAGSTLAGRKVSLRFDAAELALTDQQPIGTEIDCAGRTLSRTTDQYGLVEFSPRFGGTAPGAAVSVIVEGVTIGHAAARSTDLVASSRVATTDLADFNLFSASFTRGNPSGDLNGDGRVGLPDLGLFSADMTAAVPGTYCSRCGDGICDSGEGCGSCAADCGSCGTSCYADGLRAISTGSNAACGLTQAGAVRCWGRQSYGRQWWDNKDILIEHDRPAPVPGLSGVFTQVSVGAAHACALRSDGSVVCWGDNTRGSLGDGTNLIHYEPVVAMVSGVAQLAAGSTHTCARLTSGAVQCWGISDHGQLGDGVSGRLYSAQPVQVRDSGVPLAGATQLVSGGDTSCAFIAGGALRCWGMNPGNALWTAATGAPTFAAVATRAPAGLRALSVEGDHACAVLSTGGAYCWGNSVNGQLGVAPQPSGGASLPDHGDVLGLSTGVVDISVGYQTSCALLSSGALKCWGENSYGRIGDGAITLINGLSHNTQTRWTPVDPLVLTRGVMALSLAAQYGCAIVAGGQAKCWGLNVNHMLGDGTNQQSAIATAVIDDGEGRCAASDCLDVDGDGFGDGDSCRGPDCDDADASRHADCASRCYVDDAAQVASGTSQSCLVTASGQVRCSGRIFFGTDPATYRPIDLSRSTAEPIPGLTGTFSQVVTGGFHACALRTSGGVACWGNNISGALGDGTTTMRTSAVDVVGLTGVVELAAGGSHTCARLASGGVRCWGSNGGGELGSGHVTANSATPIDVLDGGSPLARIVRIYAGAQVSCATDTAGATRCWGAQQGVLWPSFAATPAPTNTVLPPGVRDLGLGLQHACAVLASGGVRCWGGWYYGALGLGENVQGPGDPISSGARRVSVGGYTTCALLDNGGLRCFGRDDVGQMASGGTNDQWLPATPIELEADVVDFSLGSDHGCAILSSGATRCWGGDNTFGMLGDSSTTWRTVPVYVQQVCGG